MAAAQYITPKVNTPSPQQGYRFGSLPKEVVEIIIRKVGPHLHRLAGTNKQLLTWCTAFQTNLTSLDVLITHVRYAIREPSTSLTTSVEHLNAALKEFKQRLPYLTDYHAGQKLAELACMVAADMSLAQSAPLQDIMWQQIVKQSLKMPPEQTAVVLASLGERPFQAHGPASNPTDMLMQLSKYAPAWAEKVRWAWEAQRLSHSEDISQWKALLNKLIEAGPLPPWLPAAVMKLCAAVAWSTQLKPQWLALARATQEPAATLMAFIDGLSQRVDGFSHTNHHAQFTYRAAQASNPQALQQMCRDLPAVGNAKGLWITSNERAKIIEALFSKVVAEILALGKDTWSEVAASISILHAHLLTLPREKQAMPAAALIRLLANDTVCNAFLAKHAETQVVELLTVVHGGPEKPISRLLFHAVVVAGKLSDSNWRTAFSMLLESARKYEPKLQSDVWSVLCRCLHEVPEERAAELLNEVLTWPAVQTNHSAIESFLPPILKAVLKQSEASKRQAAWLALLKFLPAKCLPKLPSKFPNLERIDLDDKVICDELLRTALQYHCELSASSQTKSQKECWAKPMKMWEAVDKIFESDEWDSKAARKLLDALIDHAKTMPRNLAPSLVRRLAAKSHIGGLAAQSRVISLIIDLEQLQRSEPLVTLGRQALTRLSPAEGKLVFKWIVTAAEHCDLSITDILLDIVPDRYEAPAYPGLTTNSNLLSLADGFLLNKMIQSWHSWRPGEHAFYSELFQRGDRLEYMRFMERIEKLDKKDRPDLLLALAGKIDQLQGEHIAKAAKALRASAARAGCKSEVDKILKPYMKD